MNGHLVTVEVGIERATYEGVQLNGLALYENRLEGLDSEAVKRGCAVKHNRMLAYHFVQNDEYFGRFLLNKELCFLDIVDNILVHQTLHDKGLEQLERHLGGE